MSSRDVMFRIWEQLVTALTQAWNAIIHDAPKDKP